MATLQGSVNPPAVKFEGLPDHNVKLEASDTPSPIMDEDMEDSLYEETGDLDFSQAEQPLWLSHLPKTLWESLKGLNDEEDIEIGTIRIEGSEGNPSRVSLMLNNLPSFESTHREYNLFPIATERIKSRYPGQALVFSEKDLPGYKPKSFAWDDLDDDGNPAQGRSFLYEKHKRDQRRKENKGRYVPYAKRSIPKQTALAGTIAREFEMEPVKNEEYFALNDKQVAELLKVQERQSTVITKGADDPTRKNTVFMTARQRQEIAKAQQARRQAQKDNRATRVEKGVLIDKLLQLFKLHRIWGLRDMKARVNQPEAYLRECLEEIAFMHKSGDFNGKWELKEEFRQRDADLMNPTGEAVAPKAEDSDMDRSGPDDDEDEQFIDVSGV